MRLKVSAASANERLLVLVTQGYEVNAKIWEEYRQKKENGTFNEAVDRERHLEEIESWAHQVVDALQAIFPTKREEYTFHHPVTTIGVVSGDDYQWKCMAAKLMELIRGLDTIRKTAIPEYTDLPIKERLHVEDIDSFSKVRDVNPDEVAGFLHEGYLNWPEDRVQLALEEILSVPVHKKDWGGEANDLYTSNVIVNGRPRPTAFLLKGNGLKSKVMEIKHCGKNGDQIIRLFQSPADLFVIQFVGTIAESVIQHAHGEIARLKTQGKEAHFLIMDGQNTARVLHAYENLAIAG